MDRTTVLISSRYFGFMRSGFVFFAFCVLYRRFIRLAWIKNLSIQFIFNLFVTQHFNFLSNFADVS